jgi:hypothetical protein
VAETAAANDSQRSPNPILRDAQALAGTIGGRGTGTPQEAAAAAYVTSRLRTMGLEPELQTFAAVPSQNTFPLAINTLALSAALVYPLGGTLSAWIAAILALPAAPLLWQAITTSGSALNPLLPKVTSQNVITRVAPKEPIRREAVLLAHLDTNRCRKVWASGTVSALEPLTWLTLAVLAALGLLYLAGAVLGGAPWAWWAALPLAIYVAGSQAMLWLDDREPFSPGAHDNAASVAVALEVADRLHASPLQQTRTWLVFSGAEETDHAGLKTLLETYAAVMRGAAFIGLEGVGSGELVYLVEQGLCSRYQPHPELARLAAQVAQDHADLQVRPGRMTMEDETGTLRRRGYKAICIAGMDPQTRSLPHWHRRDDTVETLSTRVMAEAADFVSALLAAIDREE